jgi:hypothetical protein
LDLVIWTVTKHDSSLLAAFRLRRRARLYPAVRLAICGQLDPNTRESHAIWLSCGTWPALVGASLIVVKTERCVRRRSYTDGARMVDGNELTSSASVTRATSECSRAWSMRSPARRR